MHPDRIVIGAFEDEDADRVVELHRGIDTEIVRTDVQSAELVKLAANAFLRRASASSTRSRMSATSSAPMSSTSRRASGSTTGSVPHFLRAGIGFGGSASQKT